MNDNVKDFKYVMFLEDKKSIARAGSAIKSITTASRRKGSILNHVTITWLPRDPDKRSSTSVVLFSSLLQICEPRNCDTHLS